MGTQKTGYFEEDNGNKSSLRLMSFISLLASIGFGIYGCYSYNQFAKDLTFLFITGAFAPKLIQKYAEENILRMTRENKGIVKSQKSLTL